MLIKLSHLNTSKCDQGKSGTFIQRSPESHILLQHLIPTTSLTLRLIGSYGDLDCLACFQSGGPPTLQTSCRWNVQGNQLLCLEPSLRQLQSLQCLDVSSNLLQNLDDCLATLKRLPNLTDLMIQVSKALAIMLAAQLPMSCPH